MAIPTPLKAPTRDQISKMVGGNQLLIKKMEDLFALAGTDSPDALAALTIIVEANEVNISNVQAVATAALQLIQNVSDSLSVIASRPIPPFVPVEPPIEQARFPSGTIASQNADAVEITGGTAVLETATVTTDNGLALENQTDGAGANTGTLGNAPAATDPDFWAPIQINGGNYLMPLWSAP